MHRMKIGLFAALVLLLVTFGVYTAVTASLRRQAVAEVEQNLLRASSAFSEIGQLRAADAAMQAFERAKRPSVVAVFSKTDETARREAAYAECEALNAGLAKEGRKAAIVAILGAGRPGHRPRPEPQRHVRRGSEVAFSRRSRRR